MNQETLSVLKKMLTPIDLSAESKPISEQKLDRCMPLYEAAKELGYNLYDFKDAVCELQLSLPSIISYADKRAKLIKL